MNRIMKRPMFRKGGSAGEGITSGLAPRQGYQEAGSVEQFDLRNACMLFGHLLNQGHIFHLVSILSDHSS